MDDGSGLPLSDLAYCNLTADLAEQCAALELAAFPHADPSDLLSAEDIGAYARVFPEGFFICMNGDRVVGQAAGIFLDFDFEQPQHSIAGITGDHQCGNHDPDGDWYYGTDIVVHPDYRRRGIGRRLYELRKELVVRLGRRGIIAGGYMHDFVDHKDRMSAAEYLEAVAAGEIYDATLTFQLENGFEIRALLPGYLRDEGTDDHAALIVWERS